MGTGEVGDKCFRSCGVKGVADSGWEGTWDGKVSRSASGFSVGIWGGEVSFSAVGRFAQIVELPGGQCFPDVAAQRC